MISSKSLRLMNEAGEELRVRYDDKPAIEQAIDQLIGMAKRALPSNTVFEVRGKTRPDDPIFLEPLNRKRRVSQEERVARWGVGWYWTSADRHGYYGGLLQAPLFRTDIDSAKDGPMGGYILIARLRT